jgi:hypothetical protein
MKQNLQNCFDQIKVVVLNALTIDAASPPDICAFGDSSAIAFGRSRFTSRADS